MRCRRSLLLRLLPLCLSSLPALAAPARPLLVVGTVFPRIYEQQPADGSPRGLGVDLLRRVAGRLGLELRFEFYPWSRALTMVEHGQADILVGPYRTAEREQRFHFSNQAFFEDTLVFYARRGRAPAWDGTTSSLIGHEIALVHGWSYGETLSPSKPPLRLSTVRDVATGLRMLLLGRVALLASNERDTEPVLQRLELAGSLAVVGPPLGQLRGHFAYPRHAQGQALRDALDEELGKLRARGELRELGQRWKVKIPD